MSITYTNYTPEEVKLLLGPALAVAIASVTTDIKLDPRKTRDYGTLLWTAAAGPLVDYLYSKASGSAPDLNAVLSAGNSSTNNITVGNVKATQNLQTNNNLYLNMGGSLSDAQVYWFDGNLSGAWLGYNLTNHVFIFSNVVRVPYPSGSLDAVNKGYVNSVSGSIGADLNHQVLSLYNYVDNASGSCAQNLQSVTNVGNVTNNEVIAGTLSSNGNIYVNKNGADGDSYLYFYDGSSATGQYIKWQDSNNRFYMTGLFQVATGVVSGYLASNGHIYINYDGPDGDQYLYFYQGSSGTGAYLEFVDATPGFKLSHTLDMSAAKITGVANPTAAQDAATKNYVDNISGSIGTDLNHQVLTLHNYVDNISGSIGNDLNHQVLSLYNYVDNASGSCAQNLQNVTNHGNTTSHEIIAGTLSSNGNIYVNKNGADGDSFIYFYDGGSPTGQSLKWQDSNSRFYMTGALQVNSGIIGSYLASNGAAYVNYDGPDGNSFLYFYEGSSATGAYLEFVNTPTMFQLSHSLSTPGSILADGDFANAGNIRTSGSISATGAVLQLWTNVLVVDGGGKGDYSSIQAAVAASSSGDVIFVMPGTYTETSSIVMPDGVSLIGIDRDRCIITTTSEITLLLGTNQTTPIGNNIQNITLDHNSAVGYTVSCGGSAITNKHMKMRFFNCKITSTSGNGNVSVGGGEILLNKCVLSSAAGIALTFTSGVSNYIALGTIYDCEISASAESALSIQTYCSVGIMRTYIFCSHASYWPVNWLGSTSGAVDFDSCRIQGVNSNAAAQTTTSCTEAALRFTNCHLISAGTNLIDVAAGTPTIGMYNCTINNDTKPVALTVTSGSAATNYGGTNIKR
jgi:hypothetical protein